MTDLERIQELRRSFASMPVPRVLLSPPTKDIPLARHPSPGNRSMTYHNQPAIHRTRGAIPLAGTSYLYTVSKVLWHPDIEDVLRDLLVSPSLHACCGLSQIGDVRLDIDAATCPTILGDAAHMTGVADDAFASVLCDPPYNGSFQWNHDILRELARVASERIIFQHWFVPVTKWGLYRKAQEKFALSAVYVWQPRTYFGRAQLISVFDRRVPGSGKNPH